MVIIIITVALLLYSYHYYHYYCRSTAITTLLLLQLIWKENLQNPEFLSVKNTIQLFTDLFLLSHLISFRYLD